MWVIYLDYQATTPCDARVIAEMLPYFSAEFGNPNSPHLLGRHAADAVDTARGRVAALIGAQPGEVLFSSGATESNNLAILGIHELPGCRGKRVITSPIEHKSVLGPCFRLREDGWEVDLLRVDRQGNVDLEHLTALLARGATLVTVQASNSEIGTMQEIPVVAEIGHASGAAVHCDATQSVGKVQVNVDELGVDLLSFSAHKLCGPKGIGALYVRGGFAQRSLSPLAFGGGQEGGLRPGTPNVPGIVGFGKACELCQGEMSGESERVVALRDELERLLEETIPGIRFNGALKSRLPGCSSVTFPGIEADALLANLPGVALSTGSACSSGALEPSHVLTAIGISREDAYSTIRIGMGRYTSREEVEQASCLIEKAYSTLVALQETDTQGRQPEPRSL